MKNITFLAFLIACAISCELNANKESPVRQALNDLVVQNNRVLCQLLNTTDEKHQQTFLKQLEDGSRQLEKSAKNSPDTNDHEEFNAIVVSYNNCIEEMRKLDQSSHLENHEQE